MELNPPAITECMLCFQKVFAFYSKLSCIYVFLRLWCVFITGIW